MRRMSFLSLTSFLVWMVGALVCSQLVFASSFRQTYTRGKLLLNQKLYADAVKEFEKASKSPKGKTHFATHYYLSLAYYRVGRITLSLMVLSKASKLAKSDAAREKIKGLSRQITNLFGGLKIIPEVDPDDVGKLKLVLKPKTPFSHAQKRRTFRILSKRWSKKGIALNSQVVYLPKGEYILKVGLPQCLQYGLVVGSIIVKEITIGAKPAHLALKEKVSCKCPGGQIPEKKGQKLICVCPKGSVWSKKSNRCEIPVFKDKRGFFARNWPWITAVGVGAVAAGVVAAVVVAQGQNQATDIRMEFGKFGVD